MQSKTYKLEKFTDKGKHITTKEIRLETAKEILRRIQADPLQEESIIKEYIQELEDND